MIIVLPYYHLTSSFKLLARHGIFYAICNFFGLRYILSFWNLPPDIVGLELGIRF